jgi:hypothetical protein
MMEWGGVNDGMLLVEEWERGREGYIPLIHDSLMCLDICALIISKH